MITTLLIIVFIAWIIYAYNRIIKLKNHAKEAWSGIDVQLKRRYNLIPNLIEAVKSYRNFEKDVLENITKIRSRCIEASGTAEQSEAENMLTDSFKRFFILAEAYPELKANSNFLALQEQLVEIEESIQHARRYYNGTVREYSIFSQSFPSNIVFWTFKFDKFEYFQIEASMSAPVNVKEYMKDGE